MSETIEKLGMGWLPDYPDFRDYTPEHETIKPTLTRAKAATPPKAIPVKADLRPWCSPIEDQGSLGSCTANAGVGMYEYFERRAFGKLSLTSRHANFPLPQAPAPPPPAVRPGPGHGVGVRGPAADRFDPDAPPEPTAGRCAGGWSANRATADEKSRWSGSSPRPAAAAGATRSR